MRIQCILFALVLSTLAGIAVPEAAASPVNPSQADTRVYIRAHRGGGREAPENTLAAFRHAWALDNVIPEADVRTTRDGVLICLHDETLARTTNAPDAVKRTPVGALTFDEVRRWDAGVRLGPRFEGERVPALTEVFNAMREDPARQLYLDVKGAEFAQIKRLLDEYGLMGRVIFGLGDGALRKQLDALPERPRTMASYGGKPEAIREKFERAGAEGFAGISQVQLHLKVVKAKPVLVYDLDPAFLKEALEKTRAAGVDLQVRPFRFDAPSLARLLDLGIRWFETDEPERFTDCVRQWQRE